MSYQRGRGAVLAQKRWKNGIGVSVWVTKWQTMGFARFYGYAVSRFQVSRFAVSVPAASSGLAVGMSCCSPDRSSASQVFR